MDNESLLRKQLAEMRIAIEPKTDFDVPLISITYSGDPDFQEIPSVLSDYESIEQLTITNSIWAHLPDEFSLLKNVKRLKLYLKNVTSIEGVQSMSSLISLGLYTPELELLPASLGELSQLKFLAIQSKVTTFPSSLHSLDQLKILYVDSPQIDVTEDPVLTSLSENISIRFDRFKIND